MTGKGVAYYLANVSEAEFEEIFVTNRRRGKGKGRPMNASRSSTGKRKGPTTKSGWKRRTDHEMPRKQLPIPKRDTPQKRLPILSGKRKVKRQYRAIHVQDIEPLRYITESQEDHGSVVPVDHRNVILVEPSPDHGDVVPVEAGEPEDDESAWT